MTLALLSATLAILGKVAFDIWVRYCQRQSVAAAIAGEIAGYLQTLNPSQTVAALRSIAAMEPDKRAKRLAGMSPLPSGHPMFDKVGDKVGLLPPELVQDITAFYNVISGMRLLFNHSSSEKFLGADVGYQTDYLNAIANGLEEHLFPAYDTASALNALWRESMWRYVATAWASVQGSTALYALKTRPPRN